MKTKNRRSSRRKTRKGSGLLSYLRLTKKKFTQNKQDCESYYRDNQKWFKGKTCDDNMVLSYRFPGAFRSDFNRGDKPLLPEPTTDIYDDR